MFTGLVETTGTVLSSKATGGAWRLVIAAPRLAGRWHIGDSIAVNGVCLTALDASDSNEPTPGRFAADLATETVQRTTLAQLQAGALVNLELPTPAGSPLGGHVVQGHVDGTGTLVSLIALHPGSETTDWRMTVEVPPSMVANIVPQGSVTIDGISLTVARMEGRRIEIAVIPHTYKSTNLRSLLAGTPVNLEADVLSKYAAKRAQAVSSVAVVAPTIAPPAAASIPAPASIAPPAASNLPAAPSSEGWLTAAYLIANGY
jgi:riboflavin synthase